MRGGHYFNGLRSLRLPSGGVENGGRRRSDTIGAIERMSCASGLAERGLLPESRVAGTSWMP